MVSLSFGSSPPRAIRDGIPTCFNSHDRIKRIRLLLLILFVIEFILSLDRINLALINTVFDQVEMMVDDFFNVCDSFSHIIEVIKDI